MIDGLEGACLLLWLFLNRLRLDINFHSFNQLDRFNLLFRLLYNLGPFRVLNSHFFIKRRCTDLNFPLWDLFNFCKDVFIILCLVNFRVIVVPQLKGKLVPESGPIKVIEPICRVSCGSHDILKFLVLNFWDDGDEGVLHQTVLSYAYSALFHGLTHFLKLEIQRFLIFHLCFKSLTPSWCN